MFLKSVFLSAALPSIALAFSWSCPSCPQQNLCQNDQKSGLVFRVPLYYSTQFLSYFYLKVGNETPIPMNVATDVADSFIYGANFTQLYTKGGNFSLTQYLWDRAEVPLSGPAAYANMTIIAECPTKPFSVVNIFNPTNLPDPYYPDGNFRGYQLGLAMSGASQIPGIPTINDQVGPLLRDNIVSFQYNPIPYYRVGQSAGTMVFGAKAPELATFPIKTYPVFQSQYDLWSLKADSVVLDGAILGTDYFSVLTSSTVFMVTPMDVFNATVDAINDPKLFVGSYNSQLRYGQMACTAVPVNKKVFSITVAGTTYSYPLDQLFRPSSTNPDSCIFMVAGLVNADNSYLPPNPAGPYPEKMILLGSFFMQQKYFSLHYDAKTIDIAAAIPPCDPHCD